MLNFSLGKSVIPEKKMLDFWVFQNMLLDWGYLTDPKTTRLPVSFLEWVCFISGAGGEEGDTNSWPYYFSTCRFSGTATLQSGKLHLAIWTIFTSDFRFMIGKMF